MPLFHTQKPDDRIMCTLCNVRVINNRGHEGHPLVHLSSTRRAEPVDGGQTRGQTGHAGAHEKTGSRPETKAQGGDVGLTPHGAREITGLPFFE
ncbi:hypothetical protein LCGC14_0423190 [marine sediment metagenome]|uniref:Uncharacterized protein n=1 Tax=marine sediment metagenome TaxID=412755 RepID=A0A0F9VC63_9ZZZZ